MAIEIILDGETKSVSKQELFDLAAKGEIKPDTPVSVDGKLTTAGKIKEIAFGKIETERQEKSNSSKVSTSPIKIVPVIDTSSKRYTTKKQKKNESDNKTRKEILEEKIMEQQLKNMRSSNYLKYALWFAIILIFLPFLIIGC